MNQNIIDNFKKLVTLIQLETNNLTDKKKININHFRIINLKKVIKIISGLQFKIKLIDQIKNIPGIGKHSLNRINEILTKGKLSEVKKFNQITKKFIKYDNIINELMKVIGIGRTIAKELVDKYNIKSVTELKKLSLSNKIKLNEKIKLGLKYIDKFEGNIPRSETIKVYDYLNQLTHEYDKKMFVTFCGSFRRELKISSDFDVLLCSSNIINKADIENDILKKYIIYLHKKNFLIDDITDKNIITKYMGFCRYKKKPIRRIDIRLISLSSYYPALLYFTGSYSFNQHMRLIAKKKGYKLNEYGLYDNNNNMIIVNSEQEIFDKLDMKYIEPKNR